MGHGLPRMPSAPLLFLIKQRLGRLCNNLELVALTGNNATHQKSKMMPTEAEQCPRGCPPKCNTSTERDQGGRLCRNRSKQCDTSKRQRDAYRDSEVPQRIPSLMHHSMQHSDRPGLVDRWIVNAQSRVLPFSLRTCSPQRRRLSEQMCLPEQRCLSGAQDQAKMPG